MIIAVTTSASRLAWLGEPVMASLAKVDPRTWPSIGAAARRTGTDPDALAVFRVLADFDRERSLSMLIESEIIPRMMIAHAADTPDVAPAGHGATIEPAEVVALAPLALLVEADALLAHVEAILARGVSVETVMVDLLAPAARLLGEYWEDDRCDFVDVTMGLWRLHEVVHEIAVHAPGDRLLARGGHCALFASMPGDQHNFGTVVIDELFRRNGWSTDRMSGVETPDLLKRVGGAWFDMIGLTISCDCHIGSLASIIGALRNVSRNPRVCIMVGGRIFSADPDLAMQVGADGTARDAIQALKVAADLVRVREGKALAGS